MKGLRPKLLTLVMPQNPKCMEDMRQAMVLAEQTTNASACSVNAVNMDTTSLQTEIQQLRNQLSEVLALQAQPQPQRQDWQPPTRRWTPNDIAPVRPTSNYPHQYRQGMPPHQHSDWRCNYCGGSRFHARNRCPASNQICNKCKKIGHFSNECNGSHMGHNRNYQR